MIRPAASVRSHLENPCRRRSFYSASDVQPLCVCLKRHNQQSGPANFSSAWVLRVRTALAAKHVCQSFIGILTSAAKMLPDDHAINTPHRVRVAFSPLMPENYGIIIHRWQFMDSFITRILFAYFLIDPGGVTMALAGHQCWSFIPLHTGRVLTPLAKFTDLTDCGLNAACLVFSTCPSRFATLAAQFPPILIIHQLVMAVPGRLP